MGNNENIDKIKKEIAEYFYNGFLILQQHSSFELTLNFVNRNFSRIVYVRKDGKIFGAAAYLTLTTDTFERLKRGEIDFKIPLQMIEGAKENGSHIHFFALRTDGMNIIRLGIKSIIKNKSPQTISWISQRGKLCLYEPHI